MLIRYNSSYCKEHFYIMVIAVQTKAIMQGTVVSVYDH